MKLKFGIMGAGRIAGKFVEAAASSDCAEVLAIASKSCERAEVFAEKYKIAHACSYEEMLARDDIDAVYVATTTNFHYENIKACLEAGKHTICEKAMVTNADDARELCTLARAKGLFLMEAMWSRFFPSVLQAKTWIEDGKIGNIQSVYASLGFKSTRDPSSRLLSAELGGGALFDIGVYIIELVTYLLGEAVEDAVGHCRKNHITGVDENDSFMLRFKSADAQLQCTFTAPTKNIIVINGDNGRIEIPQPHVGGVSFLYNANHECIEQFKSDFPNSNGFVYQINDAVKCIRLGKLESEIMPHSATIECAEIFDILLKETSM